MDLAHNIPGFNSLTEALEKCDRMLEKTTDFMECTFWDKPCIVCKTDAVYKDSLMSGLRETLSNLDWEDGLVREVLEPSFTVLCECLDLDEAKLDMDQVSEGKRYRILKTLNDFDKDLKDMSRNPNGWSGSLSDLVDDYASSLRADILSAFSQASGYNIACCYRRNY